MAKQNTAPTMKDVAKEAGVSLGTVSKVINGIPVGDEYRKNVEQAIKTLDYHINAYAKGLKNNRTYTVAVILPNLLNPFFSMVAHYINRALVNRGYRMLLCDTEYDYTKEREMVQMVAQNKVDGIIALTYNPDLKIPPDVRSVSIDRYLSGSTTCVASDNYNGGRLAAQTLVENFADIGQAVMDAVGRAYVLAPLFVRAVCRGDVGALALFLAVSAALFAGFCALTAWRFRRWNSRLTAGRASSGYRLRAMKTATPLAALFRKEWRRYMASPLYVMNTAIGMLLLLVASVALLVVGMDGLESALQIPDLRDGIGLALPLLLCFFIVMSNTAASAISLEGDHFQALKALPVTAKDIFRSKLLLGMLVTVPLTAVCAALLAVATRPGLPDLLLLFALPLAAAVFTPLFGLRVNLAYPHFTWKTETEVIKQSQATMIAVLGGMGLVGVAAGLTFGLQAFLPPVWTMTGVTLAFLAASALLYRNLMTKGAAKLYTL